MLSMRDIAAIKIAIEVCNNRDLKKEILCAPGSDYDINKSIHRDKKSWWYIIVEIKATAILEHSGLTLQLKEVVTSFIFSVGKEMQLWAAYHQGTIGLSREYSVNFLKSYFFTSQGMIDNVKAAQELIKEESLNIKQKYNLACLYCFIDYIPVLFRQMTTEDKIEFYDAKNPRRIKQPEFVKFWSYYLMNEIEKLKGGRNLDEYRLEKAVRSGSKTAVEYCLEKTKLRMKIDAVVDAAVEALRCRISVDPDADINWGFQRIHDFDELSWVPRDYYVDILCFLLSKMGKDQQIDLFKKEIEVIESEWAYYYRVTWVLMKGEPFERIRSEKCSIVLEYFLNWPYEDYFMKIAKLVREFLPESYFAVLLLMICDKIESKYGEGKIFDYRELLKEFWCQTPDRYKRYVFKNQTVTVRTNKKVTVRTSVGLIIKLLTLKNFTYKDEEIIKMLLASATTEEKENILSTEEWIAVCSELMAEEKWETLDRYIHYFFFHQGNGV